MFLLVATVFLLVLYAILIFFYYHHWQRLPNYHPKVPAPPLHLSVVVAARNEATRLPLLVRALALQTYRPELFELVVVDDFSTDGTPDAMAPFLNERIRMVQPEASPENSSKKKALEVGIRSAAHAWIVITDADCQPSPRWLETVAAFAVEKNASFIAAPVCFITTPSLLHAFQALDFMTLQGITAASTAAGIHSMCNGANLAYKKDLFISVGGFEGIDHIASGDDMLLMHKIKKREPGAVWYLKSRDAVVGTLPMPSWKELLMQRRRWASKTVYYEEPWIKAVLLFVFLFNCWLVVTALALIFRGHGMPLLVLLIFKTAIEWPFVQSIASFYGQKKLMRWFAVLQPLHMVFIVWVGITSQLGNFEWKGRKSK